MRAIFIATSLAVIATCGAAQDAGPRVANGRELDAYLGRCFRPPPASAGSEITLVFSLDAEGKLKGAPRISYSKLLGDVATQKAFVAAALKMLQDCTPVPVTKDFGLAAANKMRAWRLIARPSGRQQNI